MRERAALHNREDQEGAEALAVQAVDRGDTDALGRLAGVRKRTGDRDGADRAPSGRCSPTPEVVGFTTLGTSVRPPCAHGECTGL